MTQFTHSSRWSAATRSAVSTMGAGVSSTAPTSSQISSHSARSSSASRSRPSASCSRNSSWLTSGTVRRSARKAGAQNTLTPRWKCDLCSQRRSDGTHAIAMRRGSVSARGGDRRRARTSSIAATLGGVGDGALST